MFANAKALETWLKKNHAASEGLWLKIAKRGAAEPSVSYPSGGDRALDKVAALIEAGRMQAPGCAQIEAAKADGRWARAYDSLGL